MQNASCQRNYSRDVLITTWNPLFSLDITDTDPDIVYSVEVFQITCGQNLFMNRTIVMDSNATLEGLDMMDIYRAVIAAANNVPEAMDGPSVEMIGIMMLRMLFRVPLYDMIAFCRDIYILAWIHFILPGQKFSSHPASKLTKSKFH